MGCKAHSSSCAAGGVDNIPFIYMVKIHLVKGHADDLYLVKPHNIIYEERCYYLSRSGLQPLMRVIRLCMRVAKPTHRFA